MSTILCTIYNSLYLDKGLVLYDSLCECAKVFKLYVLCMDDKCYDVLADLKQEHHIPVRLSDFEDGDEELLAAKANRPMGEYCWTCSSSFIRYVLKHYNEDNCTYIDADMCFYSNPQLLVDEMLAAGKSVMVVPHWFHKDNQMLARKVGKYCVEFNTFLNNPESLEVLEYWRNRCLDTVKQKDDGIHYGDQKYLEELVNNFNCVHECSNRGAGIAPWNIVTFKHTNIDYQLSYNNEEIIKAVFFHYQGIVNISRELFVIGSKKNLTDSKLIDCFYIEYLKRIQKWRKELSVRYDLKGFIIGHPAMKHKLTTFKQTLIGEFLNYLFLNYIQKSRVVRVKLIKF